MATPSSLPHGQLRTPDADTLQSVFCWLSLRNLAFAARVSRQWLRVLQRMPSARARGVLLQHTQNCPEPERPSALHRHVGELELSTTVSVGQLSALSAFVLRDMPHLHTLSVRLEGEAKAVKFPPSLTTLWLRVVTDFEPGSADKILRSVSKLEQLRHLYLSFESTTAVAAEGNEEDEDEEEEKEQKQEYWLHRVKVLNIRFDFLARLPKLDTLVLQAFGRPDGYYIDQFQVEAILRIPSLTALSLLDLCDHLHDCVEVVTLDESAASQLRHFDLKRIGLGDGLLTKLTKLRNLASLAPEEFRVDDWAPLSQFTQLMQLEAKFATSQVSKADLAQLMDAIQALQVLAELRIEWNREVSAADSQRLLAEHPALRSLLLSGHGNTLARADCVPCPWPPALQYLQVCNEIRDSGAASVCVRYDRLHRATLVAGAPKQEALTDEEWEAILARVPPLHRADARTMQGALAAVRHHPDIDLNFPSFSLQDALAFIVQSPAGARARRSFHCRDLTLQWVRSRAHGPTLNLRIARASEAHMPLISELLGGYAADTVVLSLNMCNYSRAREKLLVTEVMALLRDRFHALKTLRVVSLSGEQLRAVWDSPLLARLDALHLQSKADEVGVSLSRCTDASKPAPTQLSPADASLKDAPVSSVPGDTAVEATTMAQADGVTPRSTWADTFAATLQRFSDVHTLTLQCTELSAQHVTTIARLLPRLRRAHFTTSETAEDELPRCFAAAIAGAPQAEWTIDTSDTCDVWMSLCYMPTGTLLPDGPVVSVDMEDTQWVSLLTALLRSLRGLVVRESALSQGQLATLLRDLPHLQHLSLEEGTMVASLGFLEPDAQTSESQLSEEQGAQPHGELQLTHLRLNCAKLPAAELSRLRLLKQLSYLTLTGHPSGGDEAAHACMQVPSATVPSLLHAQCASCNPARAESERMGVWHALAAVSPAPGEFHPNPALDWAGSAELRVAAEVDLWPAACDSPDEFPFTLCPAFSTNAHKLSGGFTLDPAAVEEFESHPEYNGSEGEREENGDYSDSYYSNEEEEEVEEENDQDDGEDEA